MKKLAFVTGANGGIGSAICEKLKENYEIIAFTRKQYDIPYEQVICDLTDTKSLEKVINDAMDKYGIPSVLVNNAGAYFATPWNEESVEQFETTLSVNITAPFVLMKNVAKAMIEKNIQGSIVNVTSVSAYIGSLDPAYAAGKAGEVAITKSFAKALAANNIRVNSVAPGPVNTKMGDSIPDHKKEEYKKVIPLHRFAEPEEMANIVEFLASDASSYMTGSIVHANGGMYS